MSTESTHAQESIAQKHRADDKPWQDPETLRRLFGHEDFTLGWAAEKLGCTSQTVSVWMDRFRIRKRNRVKSAEKVSATFRTMDTGYERVGAWNHAEAARDRAMVHRILATLLVDDLEELRGMHVHHKNGVKWDNRLDNLEVLSPGEHKARHIEEDGNPTEIPKEELLEDVRVGALALGRPPNTTDIDNWGEYTTNVYYRHWDSWGDVLEAAGLFGEGDSE